MEASIHMRERYGSFEGSKGHELHANQNQSIDLCSGPFCQAHYCAPLCSNNVHNGKCGASDEHHARTMLLGPQPLGRLAQASL